MRLTVNVATRGRPELLLAMVRETVRNISLPETVLMISLDQDDKPTIEAMLSLPRDDHIRISLKPREDSRGEKYDRALTEAQADVYLPAVDYAPILTPGFDAKILEASSIWPDGIGVVYAPMVDELVPYLQAPTAKFVEKVGHIYNREYPYWFIDHEMADIAWMIARINFADIKIDASKRPQKTLRLHDVAFWTAYYDLMALERRQKARAIINSPDYQAPDWLRKQLSGWYRLLEARSSSRNARVRASASQIEEGRGGDPPDEGYLRAKAKAEQKLSDLYTALRAAA